MSSDPFARAQARLELDRERAKYKKRYGSRRYGYGQAQPQRCACQSNADAPSTHRAPRRGDPNCNHQDDDRRTRTLPRIHALEALVGLPRVHAA